MAAGSLGTSKITETRRDTELGFLFMAPPNLSSALAKLSWANNQLKILDAETRTFLARNCYRVIEDHHPDLAGRVLKVELTEAVPESIITNAGMLIQAIRDSMDYLAVALAVHNGAVKPTDVYFPITESKDGFFAQKVGQKRSSASLPTIAKSLLDLNLTREPVRYYTGQDTISAGRRHQKLIEAKLAGTRSSPAIRRRTKKGR